MVVVDQDERKPPASEIEASCDIRWQCARHGIGTKLCCTLTALRLPCQLEHVPTPCLPALRCSPALRSAHVDPILSSLVPGFYNVEHQLVKGWKHKRALILI